MDRYGIVQFIKRENFADKRDEKNKKTKEETLREKFKDPPQAKINSNGWPDINVYDPSKDKMFWWRNDPVLNQHHEHWHIVMISRRFNGIPKDREGENFIYMHRFMLAR